MAKKVSRKELLKKPDEFITFSGKLIQFITQNRMAIMCAFGTVFAIVAAVSVMKYVNGRAEERAFTMLSEAVSAYEKVSGKVENKTEEDEIMAFETAEERFGEIIEEYPTKQGGKLARALFADICHEAGKYDQAIELYEKSLDDFEDAPALGNLILSGLAHACIAKKDYDAAIGYFENIASASSPIMKEDAYVNLWRLYAMKPDTEKSGKYSEKLITDFPDSMYVDVMKEATKKES